MRQYKAALAKAFDPTLEAPCYVTVPPHPSLWCSLRNRFLLKKGHFTFMRRRGSRAIADWLLSLLSDNDFIAYVQGPRGVGKSHLLYEAALLLNATSDCRVVYEHDCASWAVLANSPVKATLYFLRSVAVAFADDAEVLDLCKHFTACVSLMSEPVAAQRAVHCEFLPQLGDLCKQLKLKVFFVFDQYSSLKPELRSTFPYSLPEAQLLRLPQLRDVAMVVICAAADSEYYRTVATMEPPRPTRLLTCGFELDELRAFLQHERLFQQPQLDDEQLRQLSVATSRYPLELVLLRDAHNALQASRKPELAMLQRCIDVYEQGDVRLGIPGRVETFASRIAANDKRIRSDPVERQRLIHAVMCMTNLDQPLSSCPIEAELLGLCYRSDVPQSAAFTEQPRPGGPARYIRPVTPAALQAAVTFYLPDAASCSHTGAKRPRN